MTKFSVIIPTFNRLDLLKRTLNSVWAQTFRDYEVIVIDDGSSDETWEWLQTQSGCGRMIKQKRQGPGAARHAGAIEAEGLYLAFLDSDDLWFPWTLSTYWDVAQSCGAPSFIVGKPRPFSEEGEIERELHTCLRFEQFADYLESGDQWRWWGASSFVVRREIYTAAGGFITDAINGEDADLALRLGEAIGFVQITNPVTFGYRDHALNVMKDMDRTVRGARSMVWFEKHGQYPGGDKRASERHRILTRHVRPVVIACLKQGLWREAWELYLATFGWNMWLGRMRFLAGFPLMAVVAALRGVR